MPCVRVPLEGGGVAVVCTRGRRPRRCTCGAPATLLCDAPRGRGTCSAPICESCATAIGPDRHLCPKHRPQPSLFPVPS